VGIAEHQSTLLLINAIGAFITVALTHYKVFDNHKWVRVPNGISQVAISVADWYTLIVRAFDPGTAEPSTMFLLAIAGIANMTAPTKKLPYAVTASAGLALGGWVVLSGLMAVPLFNYLAVAVIAILTFCLFWAFRFFEGAIKGLGSLLNYRYLALVWAGAAGLQAVLITQGLTIAQLVLFFLGNLEGAVGWLVFM
jgi:hypothetical protein